jgi:hypothetical protein
MHKVYLLLRNNRQTGPHSLDELLQLNLKPFDLVWVEGRSAAWRYPGEIDSLKPYVSEPAPAFENPDWNVSMPLPEPPPPSAAAEPAKAITPKKVFVSMPGKAPQVPLRIYEEDAYASSPAVPEPVGEKAPEMSATVQNPAGEKNLTEEKKWVPDGGTQTHYARSLRDVEEDYTSWVYKQKTQKKKTLNPKSLGIAALTLGVVLAAYFLLSKPALVQPANEKSAFAALPVSSANNTTEQTGNTNDINPVETSPQVTDQKEKSISKLPGTIKNTKEKPLAVINKQAENNLPAEEKQEPKQSTSTATDKPATDPPSVNEPAEEKTVTTEPKKEKKKLKDVVKDIFGKKDKKETVKSERPVLEDPKPATGRQSQRRSDNESTEQPTSEVSLADAVNISSNAPESWMMGVKGLKVTLHNRNNVALQTALVNVLYYNESNELLDKKSVYFNNVPAKGKLTMPAPDHKFADHVEFKLGAVSGKDDRYAKD